MPINKKKLKCNHAYIDAANLDKGTARLGWRVDYRKLYTWLYDKFDIKRAYIFMGYMPQYDRLYDKIRNAGFLLKYKEVTAGSNGQIKGNCDSDLVLRASRDVYESVFDKAILVSSDGDFSGLVKYFAEIGKMSSVVSPNSKCSVLLMNTGAKITYLNDVRDFVRLD